MHLFGGWLFEAAFIGNEDLMPNKANVQEEKAEMPSNLTPSRFELGKAEALGALCRIFCHKKTNEDISPLYLARFYLAIQKGMSVQQHQKKASISDTLGMIFVNSYNIFRSNLEGINIVLPHFVAALEVILAEKEPRSVQLHSVTHGEVRRSAIQILLSILPLPQHFKTMKKIDGNPMTVDFEELQVRVHRLLYNALQVESDPINAQTLLGGLMLTIQEAGQAQDGAPPRSEFVNAVHLVCHRLISSWKLDLNSSLAALELLRGLARTKILESESLECKRSLKWICDFILVQCSRPPPAHSKDLHSTIVAAFHCCKTWILHHPYLMQDKECLATVLEVIELGISGSKSQGKSTEVTKDQKANQPVSRRVRDAAENLLCALMEQVDFYTVHCGAESLSSTIDEVAYVYLSSGEMLTMLQAAQNFRYYVLDNNILFAVYEDKSRGQQNGNNLDQQAKVAVVLRGMSSRSAWTMQLRHLPRHKSGQKTSSSNPGRPLPMDDQVARKSFKSSFFPESIDKIPLCKADKSIPAVESVALDERSLHELDQLSHLMDEQAHLEESITQLTQYSEKHDMDSTSPEPCQDYQAARLLLSHLGLLKMFGDAQKLDSNIPAMVPLSTDNVDFINDLEKLDRQSTRTAETVQIYYMKNGQKHPEEILRNVQKSEAVSKDFLDFLATLGWPVNVWAHTGWTGRLSTSWRSQHEPMVPPTLNNHGGAIFNGDHHVLYWADSESEIAFTVPTKVENKSDSESDLIPAADKARLTRQSSVMASLADLKIAVVWLENFDDIGNFPGDALLMSQDSIKDVIVIFVHVMSNELLKVKLVGHHQGVKLVLPLMSDMVMPKKCLGPMVRQTVVNLSDRRRLDFEGYQPPLVRRRLLIQEIRHKYANNLSEADFFTDLFTEI